MDMVWILACLGVFQMGLPHVGHVMMMALLYVFEFGAPLFVSSLIAFSAPFVQMMSPLLRILCLSIFCGLLHFGGLSTIP